MNKKISVTILVKNGERCLDEVLNALRSFDEIVLYDTGSTDQTLSIAQKYPNVNIFRNIFQGFGISHNEAADRAQNDWILSIDADEVLSCALAEEILALNLREDSVYSIPFYNFFNGKQIKCCGWHPESHVRLYNRTRTRFSQAQVHEGVLTKGFIQVALAHPIYHYPYSSISDFLIKMERYSDLFAQQYKNKRASSPLTAFLHGFAAFMKSYFLKKGFLGGYEGFLISAYNGHTAYYKYLKLYHANLS